MIELTKTPNYKMTKTFNFQNIDIQTQNTKLQNDLTNFISNYLNIFSS